MNHDGATPMQDDNPKGLNPQHEWLEQIEMLQVENLKLHKLLDEQVSELRRLRDKQESQPTVNIFIGGERKDYH